MSAVATKFTPTLRIIIIICIIIYICISRDFSSSLAIEMLFIF